MTKPKRSLLLCFSGAGGYCGGLANDAAEAILPELLDTHDLGRAVRHASRRIAFGGLSPLSGIDAPTAIVLIA